MVDDGLNALSWVHDELRRSLDATHKSLRRYLKAAAEASDLDPVDPSILRHARAQLHAAVGAVELIGLGTPGLLLSAAEAALQRLSLRPKLLTATAVGLIEQGSFALLDYITRRLSGKPVTPLALFPQYKALQELAGASRVHPADLWPVSFTWRRLAVDPSVVPRHADVDTVARVEADLLAQMRGAPPSVSARMSEVFASLAAGLLADLVDGPGSTTILAATQATERRLATLWQLAAAFYEAQADGLLKPDVYSKRMGSRLLAQLRAGDRSEPSERLAHDLLFFCSQATPRQGLPVLGLGQHKRLSTVRQAYALADEPVIDFEVPRLGRHDPAWVAQARKRVAAAKDVWAGVAGGDLLRLNGLTEQMALVSDSLQRLYPNGEVLGRALQAVAQHTTASGVEPPAALAMEVATALLYVDASLDDGDFSQTELPARLSRLAQRIELVRQQKDPGTLELWMEDLYRRVSDRQTMGSVVQELRGSLSEIEKAIDQYFRNPAQRDLLIPVPNQLQAMRGVLSVLGLDQASQAVLRMSEDVDALSDTEADPQRVLQSGSFERLADNLGALSFLIDMVAVQPQMAKSLFQFDPVTGALSATMAREERPSGFSDFVDSQPAPAETAPQTDAVAVSLEFDRLVEQAGQQPRQGPATNLGATLPMAGGPDPLLESLRDGMGLSTLVPADMPPLAPAAALAGPGVAAAPDEPAEVDPHMRAVFVDEVHELAPQVADGLEALDRDPADPTALKNVRRFFHTLKGSARMVQLHAFADAAWAFEQLYNARLGQGLPTDAVLQQQSRQAVTGLVDWIAAVSQGRDEPHRAAPLIALAQGQLPPDDMRPLPAAEVLSEGALGAHDLAASEFAPTGFLVDMPPPVPALPIPRARGLGDEAVTAPLPGALGSLGAGLSSDLSQRVPGLPMAGDLDLPDLSLTPPGQAPAAGQPSAPPEADAVRPGAAPAHAPTPTPAAAPFANLWRDDLPTQPAPLDLLPQTEARDELGAATVPLPEPLALPEAPVLLPTISLADLDDSPLADAAIAPTVPLPAGALPPLEALSPLAPVVAEPAAELVTAEADALGDATVPLPGLPLGAVDPLAEATPSQLLDLDLSAEAAGLAEPAGADLALDLSLDEPAPAAAAAFGSAPAAADSHEVDLDLDLTPNPPEPTVELPAAPAASAADTTPLPTPLPPSDEAGAYRQIGPLRISVPLLNIFLHEADELSRQLVSRLAEWRQWPARPLGGTAVAKAHSLAGNAGTVGYIGLLDFARTLEHTLERVDASGGSDEQGADTLCLAADEIARVLHLFAAGFLVQPNEALRLQVASLAQQLPGVTADGRPAIDDSPSAFAHLHEEPPVSVFGLGEFNDSALSPLSARAEGQIHRRPAPGAVDAFDDELDLEDQIDADLFPIFEEEAQEQLPMLHASLRAWAAQPGDAAAPSACMRTLHTFKGGARLAGAMRVGELAHRLETAVEQLLSSQVATTPADVDRLVVYADTLAQQFELLRGQAASARPVDSPSDAPVEAVSGQGGLHTPDMAQAAGWAPVLAPAEPVPEAPPAQPAQPLAEAQTPVDPALAWPAQPEPERVAPDQLSEPAGAQATAPAPAPEPAPEPATATLPEAAPERAPAAPAPVLPAPAVARAEPVLPSQVNWARFASAAPTAAPEPASARVVSGSVRVRAALLDRLVSHAGEVGIARARVESEVQQMKTALVDLSDNLERLRAQLREIELQAESSIGSRIEQARASQQQFDPLEMDRFTRFQELTRMMAESVGDVATVQRGLQRTVQATEDTLAHQHRMTRDMQDDLLRTRLVEFEGLSDRLYRVVRQAGKETGKPVRLDINGGSIEVDRGVLDRMTPVFEHLLRNSVVHGIEAPAQREAAGKPATGTVSLTVGQIGNEVAVEVRDDGAGLHLARIRDRARSLGLIAADAEPDVAELANLIFQPGFTTADEVTDLAGRGVGMDVVRTEVYAIGGRIETATAAGQGTSFRLVLPLTTAVTQVVLLRCAEHQVAVPATLVESVTLVPAAEVEAAYHRGAMAVGNRELPFFWLPSLLQGAARGVPQARNASIVVVRSGSRRIVLHVDEVLGNQEVVVKPLGPQLSRLPALVGLSLMPSGQPALIYNPVGLAMAHGASAQARVQALLKGAASLQDEAESATPQAPLVMVVDDSLTVRRITQRLLEREGYRVLLAKDGQDALDRLAAGELPRLVLSDIEMPRMDGFDLLRALRAEPRTQALPVVMITSRLAQKHRDYAAELGANHYLGKPYAEDELLGLLARYAPLAAAVD